MAQCPRLKRSKSAGPARCGGKLVILKCTSVCQRPLRRLWCTSRQICPRPGQVSQASSRPARACSVGMSIRPCPPSLVREPGVSWTVAKGALQRQQQRRLVVFDFEQVVPAVLHDVRTQGPLRKHGVAGDQDVGQVDLTQQGQGLSEFVLPLVNRQLRQDGSAATGEGAEQIGARQGLLPGPTY